ncbi:hypothetical protein NLJ89_g11993 [Agrocybe chaxingu]|uniref:Uncharacterized protein n=1 Tax=Agrocybe chaxingu TaxID=84603 RepID=A0A9W8JVQ4_9AGAR|nr:hypothetical protein NLJ89_g11993 [Agrocybe chaxingu]
MMFMCMDANFRLKNNLVSNYSQDPGLGIGWAYMVPRKPYEDYVVSQADDGDISTCVSFQAIAKANIKKANGLRVTGTGGLVCGRSEMILPVSIGNLQKGERYSNMDYVFGSAMKTVAVPLILISYDIACQWFINLFKRMNEHWPDSIKIPPSKTLIPAIPKLHEPMHQSAGHQVFSLNFIPGAGLSDCECLERVWAHHNALGNSTKTQGPGSRQDVLDDHFGFWNWQKYINLGRTLLRRYKAAVADRNIQREGHRGLSEPLEKELLLDWEAMCVEWDADNFPKSAKNPYETDGITISEAQVKKDLALEEQKRLAAGGVAFHETTAAGFLSYGLELEEVQRRIKRLVKETAKQTTDRKEGTLTEQRNLLRARLRNYEQLAYMYMLGLLQYQINLQRRNTSPPTLLPAASQPLVEPSSDKPEDSILWLPSSIPAQMREKVCQLGLPEMEDKLREAQCQDALESVRHILKIKTRMILFKNRNIRASAGGG